MGSSNEEYNDCKSCKYISIDGDDYSTWGFANIWHECTVTSYDNLSSFPFIKTKCKKYKQKQNKNGSIKKTI